MAKQTIRSPVPQKLKLLKTFLHIAVVKKERLMNQQTQGLAQEHLKSKIKPER